MRQYDYSNEGFALTRSFEGLRLSAYQDCAAVWTIGYGHTGPEVHQGQRISEFEAEALLRVDLAAAIACVRRAVTVDLTQRQFDALVDFCFNTGRGNFVNSSLLKYVNRGEFASVLVQFGLWVHAGGEVISGLVRRRAAEAALFAGREFGVHAPGAKAAPASPLPQGGTQRVA
ncbi:MAG TPA: lysozyme [Acidobacteriaceae bacterium]|jgi:lysozyme|nr:lysozyme [Acidobacteriaceae bacterium]